VDSRPQVGKDRWINLTRAEEESGGGTLFALRGSAKGGGQASSSQKVEMTSKRCGKNQLAINVLQTGRNYYEKLLLLDGIVRIRAFCGGQNSLGTGGKAIPRKRKKE